MNIFNLLLLFCLGRNKWVEIGDGGKDYIIIDIYYKIVDGGILY